MFGMSSILIKKIEPYLISTAPSFSKQMHQLFSLLWQFLPNCTSSIHQLYLYLLYFHAYFQHQIIWRYIKIITYIYKQSYAAIGSSTFNIRKICLRHTQLFSHFRLFYTHFLSSLLKPGSNIYNSFFHNFLTRTLSNY